ncbi:MAG TPA: hypothetical protein PLB02_04820 [Thermoanaerobaculia bacterium]|nr:hypothetical protein [Thermoanaerobaculia bacterium]HQR66695.1 hypothetical protein [Thermoanaerobaculia bacterium]
MSRAVTIRYRVAEEDYVAFNRFIFWRKRWLHLRNVVGLGAALALVFSLLFASAWGSLLAAVPAGLAIGAAASASGAWLFLSQMKRSARSHLERSGGAGEREVELSARGVQGMTPPEDGFQAWDAVALAGLTPAHLFVLVDPTLAYVIPRSALPGEALEIVRTALPGPKLVETRR